MSPDPNAPLDTSVLEANFSKLVTDIDADITLVNDAAARAKANADAQAALIATLNTTVAADEATIAALRANAAAAQTAINTIATGASAADQRITALATSLGATVPPPVVVGPPVVTPPVVVPPVVTPPVVTPPAVTPPPADVPVITGPASAAGVVGQAFQTALVATNSPTAFAIDPATPLPDGLVLDTATGIISGTPTVVAETVVNVAATNASGPSPVATLDITITAAAQAGMSSATRTAASRQP